MNEYYYLAGILDTNGAIGMRRRKGYAFPMVRLCGRVEMLNMFAEEFGGRVTKIPSRPNYCWTKQGIEATRILTIMRPYMWLRAEEVDKCLAWECKHPDKAKGPANRVAKRIELECDQTRATQDAT